MLWMWKVFLLVFYYFVKLLVKVYSILVNVEIELGIDKSKFIVYLFFINLVID